MVCFSVSAPFEAGHKSGVQDRIVAESIGLWSVLCLLPTLCCSLCPSVCLSHVNKSLTSHALHPLTYSFVPICHFYSSHDPKRPSIFPWFQSSNQTAKSFELFNNTFVFHPISRTPILSGYRSWLIKLFFWYIEQLLFFWKLEVMLKVNSKNLSCQKYRENVWKIRPQVVEIDLVKAISTWRGPISRSNFTMN